ncbi:MAG: peptidoglycan-binding protein [Nannocystaceae bacterium]
MPKTHKVAQGDCISSIAASHFMLPETIWDAPDNEPLKADRPHGNALAPGDEVVIPDPKERIESAAVDGKYRYVRKGVPEKIELVLLDEDGEPRAQLAYQVELPGDAPLIEGETADDGMVKFTLPPKVRAGTLRLGAPDFEEEHELSFGGVDPITTVRGLQHRLRNLGYAVEATGTLDDRTTLAVQSFQSDAELDVTGEVCDQTRAKLEERYGS